ncbi:MAG: metallophosphoesterase [Thermoleophilia bacterium]|nr:metallophosphoesterase [Thermoleophilia bacterium]
MRRLRPAARYLLSLLVIATLTVAGMAAGLMVGGTSERETSFARLQTSVVPSLRGHVTVFVPLVDWKVGLLDHPAPVDLHIELRGLNRDSVGVGLSSSGTATQSLTTIRRDSTAALEAAVRRAMVAAGIGGLVGAIVAGLLLAAITLRRRWTWVAPLVGAAITVLFVGTSTYVLSGLDHGDVVPVSSGENAEELPYVMRFAQQLLYVGDEYEQHYATALASVENLVEFSGSTTATGGSERSAFVVSDIHDNVFVLDALDDLAGDDTVFAVGDFVQVGAEVEERTAAKIAGLGGRVVAVSGNHDSASYMEELAEAGATVLGADRDDDSDDVTEVDGLAVAAWPDPLERRDGSNGDHKLRVYGEEYDAQVDDFIAWFDELEEWPDLVLVHQHGLAHRLAKRHRESGDPRRLQILTGHDHVPHVDDDGTTLIIDGGTLGAGGFAAIGEQDASFARIHFRGAAIVAVDVVSVEPLTGRASAERVRVGTGK